MENMKTQDVALKKYFIYIIFVDLNTVLTVQFVCYKIPFIATIQGYFNNHVSFSLLLSPWTAQYPVSNNLWKRICLPDTKQFDF